MSLRTSSRIRNPSAKLLEATAPSPPPVAPPGSTTSSRSAGPSKRRKVEPKTPAKRGRGKKAQSEKDHDGDDQGQDDDDPDKKYCLCQRTSSETEGMKMIECAHCGDWFHFKCIKMTQAQANQIHEYTCPRCEESSGGTLKTIRTSDISLLPSPPRSTSPIDLNHKVKGGKKAKSVTSSKGGKGKRKSAAVNGGDEADALVLEDEEEESESSSSESETSSVESAGSGDNKWTKKKGHDEGRRPYRGKRAREGSDDDSSETASEGVDEAALDTRSSTRSSVDHSAKRPRLAPKRKSSGAAAQATNKQRRRSSLATPDIKGGNVPEADQSVPIRQYCINKLTPTIEVIFTTYHAEVTEARAKEGEDSKMDEDGGEAVIAPAIDIHGRVLSQDEAKLIAKQYVNTIEITLFSHFKEYSPEKKMMVPGPKYKQQVSLLISSLENDLRPDLRQGMATSSIPAERFALMDANDLATEAQLKERRRLEEESMKNLVRPDDSYQAIKYTKKGLEDAETLQRIQSDISRRLEDESRSEAKPNVGEEVEAMQIKGERRASLVSNKGAEAATPDMEVLDSPARVAPVPMPELGPSRSMNRQSSFSLSAVLGTSGASAMQPLTYVHEEAIEEEGGATSGWTDGHQDAPEYDPFDEYVAQNKVEAPPQPEEVVVSPEEEFLRLPVVWKGSILNPADPDNPPPLVEARQVGGPDFSAHQHMWSLLMPQDPIHLVGRVPVKDSAKYLLNCRLSPSKELVIVAFTPRVEGSTDEDKEKQRQHFEALAHFHISRGRHGVNTPYPGIPPPGAPKEVYLVPLRPGDNYEFLDLMDRFILPEERTKDVILGVFIIPKPRDELLIPPPPVVAPAAVPPPPPPPPPAASAPTPPLGTNNLSELLASLKPEALQQIIASTASAGATSMSPMGPPPVMPPFPPTMPPGSRGNPAPPRGFMPAADGRSTLPGTSQGLTPPGGPYPSASPPAGRAAPPVHPSRMGFVAGGQPGGADSSRPHQGHGANRMGYDARHNGGGQGGHGSSRW